MPDRENLKMTWIEKTVSQLPLVSGYAEQRGVAYVISWLHRISGVFIVGFIGFHLLTLQLLRTPHIYDTRMAVYNQPVLILLEWALALPIIFHALNGGRLVLFESFGYRKDDTLLSWVVVLWLLYCSLLGATMLTGSKPVAAGFYWLWALTASATLVYIGTQQIWPTAHAITWKLQRLSGLFLMVMVPAHLLFMHLNPMVAKDASTVLARMHNPFIKFVDLTLVAAVLYHGAYGLISIAADYVAGRVLRRLIVLIVALTAVVFALLAIRLTFLA